MQESLGIDADFGNPASPVISGPSRLKMAPFGMNESRGVTPSLGKGTIEHLDFPQQVRIARLAESAGMEGIIAGARWRGYEGVSNWCRESYDGIPWSAGIGAATEKIVTFSTIHVPLTHPIAAAKAVATSDHVSGGRYALNIVAGWNVAEFAMFGLEQDQHEGRYQRADEWTSLLKRLWSEDEPFDYDGAYYSGHSAMSSPRPIQSPRPPIMSAGSSPAGRQFAAKHADICFILALDLQGLREAATDIRARASELGRTVQIWTPTSMLCGETEADAQRQYDYFVHENGDWHAAEFAIRELLSGGSKSLQPVITQEMIESRVRGAFGYRLFGSAEHVVEGMQQLTEAGVDGIATVWFDYERGIETYRDLVLPLAQDAGVRAPLV